MSLDISFFEQLSYPVNPMPSGPVITIGNFDGVHLGHQQILSRARLLADELQTTLLAITFDPPPAHLIRPDMPVQSLSTIDQRVIQLKEAGANAVKVLTPTSDWLEQSPQIFIKNLMANHHLGGMVEGDDFHFGKNRQGDIPLLCELAGEMDFVVQIVEPVEVLLHDRLVTRVSSTLIRWLLAHGRVADVALCLGHPYELTASIIKGEQRGRMINVPTANLDMGEFQDHALPANGVYGGYAILENDQRYPAAISLGIKPTFNGKQRTLEAHLLDFEGNLYNRKVTLQFTRWIRHQQPFPTSGGLQAQLNRDINHIRQWMLQV